MARVIERIMGTSDEASKEKLGYPFILIIIYLFMEYARPVNPLKVPMLISIILLISWLMLPKRHWKPQIFCFMLLISAIAVMGPFAINSYAIFWDCVGLTVQLLCICVPIIHFVNSFRKLIWFINILLALFVYIAVFAMLHSGFGPGGHVADENDTALALNCFIPFAFFSIFVSRLPLQKVLYGAALGIMVVGVIMTKSRGGFVGLVPVLLYCFLLTPNKLRSIGIGCLLLIGIAIVAPDSYWHEISSIVTEAENDDPNQGTGALRRLYWDIAKEMFYANPIFGVGLGNFSYNAEFYQTPEQHERIGRTVGSVAHSLYFTILAELGISGAILYSALVYFNVRDLSSLISWSKLRHAGKVAVKNAQRMSRPFAHASRTRGAGGRNVLGLNDPHLSTREGRPIDSYDANTIMYYSHATRAGLLGFLCSGVFLSVFVYPHFWLLTALTVVLKVLMEKTTGEEHSGSSGTSSSLSSSPLSLRK